MTKKEKVALVSAFNFFLSESNYYTERGDEERVKSATRAASALQFQNRMLGVELIVHTLRGLNVAVSVDLGNDEYYIEWSTSCDIDTDDETYEEFKAIVERMKTYAKKVYSTNGDKGMIRI